MKIISQNKKARFNYEILETYEAGVVLTGSEVKSIRNGHVNINDAFARFIRGELYLVNANISEYRFSNLLNHEPTASRKLLLHKVEIKKLLGKVQEKSYTLVPLKMYFNARNRIKLEIALGRGKKLHDKRDSIKEKDLNRDSQRELKNLKQA
ncbi:MAG: SsrA-binding protein [Spirochaetae bacterium HGW-Spirochaetae-6]|nr:MAG: SsrA-binding protein [Spirochaetae bacterium HGW-Spirochaetae-6]